MSNPFDETRAAVEQARSQLQAVDDVAFSLADLLQGRLRMVAKGNNTYSGTAVLRRLKRELRDFDAVTGTWKEQK